MSVIPHRYETAEDVSQVENTPYHQAGINSTQQVGDPGPPGEVYQLQASDVIIDSATDSDEEHVVEVILDDDGMIDEVGTGILCTVNSDGQSWLIKMHQSRSLLINVNQSLS